MMITTFSYVARTSEENVSFFKHSSRDASVGLGRTIPCVFTISKQGAAIKVSWYRIFAKKLVGDRCLFWGGV